MTTSRRASSAARSVSARRSDAVGAARFARRGRWACRRNFRALRSWSRSGTRGKPSRRRARPSRSETSSLWGWASRSTTWTRCAGRSSCWCTQRRLLSPPAACASRRWARRRRTFGGLRRRCPAGLPGLCTRRTTRCARRWCRRHATRWASCATPSSHRSPPSPRGCAGWSSSSRCSKASTTRRRTRSSWPRCCTLLGGAWCWRI
mmetsp:Transcript_38052/g.116916  ORF Transcript_38052/g.116916 Transcript_38052/m.116916 type:complete len:205 (+) Transcript_38052:338-952(+)